ncbi:MAG: glutathione synthase [Hyphomicrobiales bacterium]
MGVKVAVQMDPIEAIDISGDSTFALMLEAQARGHELFYYHTSTLALEGDALFATGHSVAVRDEQGDHFTLGARERVDLRDSDVVLMRQDPPFDMGYITATHMLERIHPDTLVVNNPAEVRNAPEKLFVLDFQQFMPPTLITRDWDEIKQFRNQFGDMILKPLYGNGGAGVFRLQDNDQNLNSLLELFDDAFTEPFIAQQYLPDVRAGDKRIILIDGVPAGAINRVPAEGESRSNMHVGGRPEPIELTKRDQEICEALEPELKKRGMIFVGIDVIGDYLTEINVTSPTGIREVKNFGGEDIAELIWEAIESHL